MQIIDWLNGCPIAGSSTNNKCEVISKIQEVVLHSDSELLEEFLTEILAFSHDPTQEVKRAVIGFIEEVW